jgi:ubiquinone/menaquinone biosynthesis C-methylase UbiE
MSVEKVSYDLLIDLHKANKRQGPGGDEQTKQALQLSGLDRVTPLLIADVGCGTGASTLTLAENLNASIVAVDLFEDFLDVLRESARKSGVTDKIKTLVCPMEDLPFDENSLDVIWAEGAIYNMGFAKGVEYFKRFLKPGGILAVSEITWMTKARPEEIQQHWDAEYSEIATVSDKVKTLENHGYILKGYFPLPASSWLDNYYAPLESSLAGFLSKHDSDDARKIVEAERSEIALYRKYNAYYSYGFYIAQKVE